jgi:hypothetical protein
MLQLALRDGRTLLVFGFPLLGLAIGYLVYRDARDRGRGELAPAFGVAIGGLFLAGSVPGLVALAVSSEAATQGFPTALRIVPALVAVAAYLRFR